MFHFILLMKHNPVPESYQNIIDSLTNRIDYEIFMQLIIHNELSLSELTELIDKSKPTIHRHAQSLLEAELIYESKEEIVRGNIPAKFYKANPSKLQAVPRITPNHIKDFTDAEKRDLLRQIQGMINSTVSFANSSFENFSAYLQELGNDREKLDRFLRYPDLLLNLNFLSKRQFAKWQDLYRDYMMKFLEMMRETETDDDTTRKPYVYFTSMLPFHKIFDVDLSTDKTEDSKKMDTTTSEETVEPFKSETDEESNSELVHEIDRKSEGETDKIQHSEILQNTEIERDTEKKALSSILNLINDSGEKNAGKRVTTDGGKVTALNLLNLYEIPKALFDLKNLTDLNLSRNNIEVIPSELAELTALKVFSAEKNEISQLPREFVKLSNLEVLDLSDNKMDNLPDHISGLKKLRLVYI